MRSGGWLGMARGSRAVVAWVELIETLVQTEERRYGRQSRLGAVKKEEIKEVIRRAPG